MVIGVARRPFTREDFRHFIRSEINIKIGQYKEEDVKHFLDHMTYVQGLFDEPELYTALSEKIKNIEKIYRVCANKLFHLSVPPNFYDGILSELSASGLTIPCVPNGKSKKANNDQAQTSTGSGWTRVLVEKPFGHDVNTAIALEKRLASLFDETQIFRIDHYLAKEAVQNILAFRFANSIFEPLWNKDFIDKVHIKLLEKIGIEGRGNFYDEVGALKDVGQNHVLQMLALIAMDEPDSFDAMNIRKERYRVLSKLESITEKTISECVVRGQYDGYTNEKGVKPNSETETYFRIESYIDSARWKKVPFYIESGKAMAQSKTEIDVYFKSPNGDDCQNIVTFRIQPDEGIKIKFWVKTPGFGLNVEPKMLKFKYSDFNGDVFFPDAYERVLYDAIMGDQTLFASTNEVMSAWEYITPIIENWKDLPIYGYEKGTEHVDF